MLRFRNGFVHLNERSNRDSMSDFSCFTIRFLSEINFSSEWKIYRWDVCLIISLHIKLIAVINKWHEWTNKSIKQLENALCWKLKWFHEICRHSIFLTAYKLCWVIINWKCIDIFCIFAKCAFHSSTAYETFIDLGGRWSLQIKNELFRRVVALFSSQII